MPGVSWNGIVTVLLRALWNGIVNGIVNGLVTANDNQLGNGGRRGSDSRTLL